MVPTGYSLSGTLFLKIRTASFSFSGSAFLIYVFLILCPSRIQVKDFSETVTSCAYTLHTIERNKVNAVPVKRVVIVFIAATNGRRAHHHPRGAPLRSLDLLLPSREQRRQHLLWRRFSPLAARSQESPWDHPCAEVCPRRRGRPR